MEASSAKRSARAVAIWCFVRRSSPPKSLLAARRLNTRVRIPRRLALCRTSFEFRLQRQEPFADRLASHLMQAREQHRDRNAESGFAGEGRPQGRQAATPLVARHLRPVPATHEKGHLTLGETRALAVG